MSLGMMSIQGVLLGMELPFIIFLCYVLSRR